MLAAASCTTNAIVPVLKVIDENYTIQSGHIETVHAYTNDQNLIDNYHPSDRRGRSAALNLVITDTGAAKAVSQILPEMKGKLTANAIRVPTPNVSLAIMNLNVKKSVSVEELNKCFREVAFHSNSKLQLTTLMLSMQFHQTFIAMNLLLYLTHKQQLAILIV